MRSLVANKKKSKRVRRKTTKNRPQLIGGGHKLLPARVPYAKRNGGHFYTVAEATIYLCGYRLVRAPYGRRIHYRIPVRHPVINDSTPPRLEDVNSTLKNTSSFAEVDSPLSYLSTGPQLTPALLPYREPNSTHFPYSTTEQQNILPLSPGPVKEVPKDLTEIGRRQLVERLMEEFWNIFNRGSTVHGNHTSENSSGVPRQGLDTFSQSTTSMPSATSLTCGQKRARSQDGDGDDPNIPRKQNRVSGNRVVCPEFACPYQKHDPQKYNSAEWRFCSLVPFNSVARVKEHLYRRHRIFQCSRCKSTFNHEVEKQEHLLENFCKPGSTPVVDGITEDIERQLKSRKRRYPGQSEESRWKDVYRILFPSGPVPVPYFEAPSEKSLRSDSDDRALENYETYVRHQLPGFFRSAIEAAVNQEIQPIEERLRSQLLDIIQGAQERVFQNYRATNLPSALPPYSTLHFADSLTTPETNQFSSNAAVLQGAVPYPTFDLVSGFELDFTNFESQAYDYRMTEYADSGYGSVSPTILQKNPNEERIPGKKVIPWAYGPGDIQDAIYPRYCAINANINTQRRRVLLSSETTSLLDRVMRGFWSTIFDQGWLYSFRAHGNPSSSKRGGKGMQRNQISKASNSKFPKSKNDPGGRKRKLISTSDDEEEEDGRKKVVVDPDDDEDLDLDLGFACPYRKNFPSKYNVTDWAPCALTSRPTIARVKSHLYKYHFVHQCQRCNGIYGTEQLLNDHINAVQACDVIESQQGGRNGINRSLKDLISSRKILFPGQTERQKWEHIYQLIFPGEPLPLSPYWDDPDLQERLFVDRYHEYLLQELPQTVRRDLERLIGNDSDLNEERILEQAVSLLPAALSILWHTFRGTFDPNPSRDDIVVDPSARTTASTIDPSIVEEVTQEATIVATNIALDFPLSETQPIEAQQHRTSNVTFSGDSAYFSGDSNVGGDSSRDDIGDLNGEVGNDGYECDTPRRPNPPVNEPEAENELDLSIQAEQAPEIRLVPDTEHRNSVPPQSEISSTAETEQSSLQSGQVLPDAQPQLFDELLRPMALINWDNFGFDFDAFVASSEQTGEPESATEELGPKS